MLWLYFTIPLMLLAVALTVLPLVWHSLKDHRAVAGEANLRNQAAVAESDCEELAEAA